jgi:hypothetical protein
LNKTLSGKPGAVHIDNQQFHLGQLPLAEQQALFVSGFHQFIDQCCRCYKGHRQPLLTSRKAQPERDVGLASA